MNFQNTRTAEKNTQELLINTEEKRVVLRARTNRGRALLDKYGNVWRVLREYPNMAIICSPSGKCERKLVKEKDTDFEVLR